jgi:hypothetical protein
MNLEQVRLFSAGPLMILFLLACLASVALLAAAFRRAGTLAAFTDRAARRLERGRALPTLWGLSVAVLLVVALAILGSVPALGLLTLTVLVLSLTLLALGTGAAAITIGRDLHEAFSVTDPGDDLVCLRTGVAAFFLAAILPVAGWLLVLLALASGVGAIVEALLTQRSGGAFPR